MELLTNLTYAAMGLATVAILIGMAASVGEVLLEFWRDIFGRR